MGDRSPASLRAELQHRLEDSYSEQVMSTAVDKCYHKCVPYPSTELSSRERDCMASCIDRFVDAMNIVSTTLRNRR